MADAYEVMTSVRTYRKPLTYDKAINELVKNAGTQFDPQIVRSFVEEYLKNSLGDFVLK